MSIWTFILRSRRLPGYANLMVMKLFPPSAAVWRKIQQRLVETLDKINNLPLNPMIEQATNTLSESQRTMRRLQNHAG
ncbi:paraquat-inducible protein B [Salmonella sp. NCTC 11881]|nr:paraquat-inducible protein B [Salmonella sp. NCTC 11881]